MWTMVTGLIGKIGLKGWLGIAGVIALAVVVYVYGSGRYNAGVDHGYEQSADEIRAVQAKYDALLKARTETTTTTSTAFIPQPTSTITSQGQASKLDEKFREGLREGIKLSEEAVIALTEDYNRMAEPAVLDTAGAWGHIRCEYLPVDRKWKVDITPPPMRIDTVYVVQNHVVEVEITTWEKLQYYGTGAAIGIGGAITYLWASGGLK